VIPVLIFLLIVVLLGVTVYSYLRWEQDRLASNDDNMLALDVFKLKLQKNFCQIREFIPNIFKWLDHHPRQIMVFVGVTCVHFLIVYILSGIDNILVASRSFWKTLIYFILIVPNFILPIDGFPWPFIFSSFTYGGVGVFLESRKTSLQVIGIIFIVFFILAGFVFTFVVMFMQAFT
jgi:hypothetical protein